MSKLKSTFTFLVSIGVTICLFVQSTAIGNEDCVAFLKKCDPKLQQPCCDSNYECINLERDKEDREDYACYKAAKLGDSCQHYFDCRGIIDGKCSENGTCSCKSLSAEYNDTICMYPTVSNKLIPEIAANYIYDDDRKEYHLKDDYKSQTGLDRRSRIKYGEICHSSNDCLQPDHLDRGLVCDLVLQGYRSSECKCPNGKRYNLEVNSCKDISKPVQKCSANEFLEDGICLAGVNGDCLSDKDCEVEETHCDFSSKKCVCNPGYVKYSVESCQLDPLGKCNERGDCLNIKYSQCAIDGTCECKQNYRKIEGLCKGIHEAPCDESSDCSGLNVECREKKCQCIAGYGFREDHCFRIPTGPGDVPEIADDCKYVKNTIFSAGKCDCIENYYPDVNHCFKIPTIPYTFVETSKACDFLENTTYSNHLCTCSPGFYFDVNHCYKIPDEISIPVNTPKACTYLENTTFVNGTCECKEGYYEDDDHCYLIPLKLGDPVDSETGCYYLDDTIYVDGKCECSPEYYEEDDSCHFIPTTPDHEVYSETGCYYLDNTTYFDGLCVCDKGYYYENHYCSYIPKKPYTPVDSAKACQYLPNTIYVDGKCKCKPNHFYENYQCYEIPKKPYEPVETAAACKWLGNTVFANDTCVCCSDCYFENNTCWEIPTRPYEPVDNAMACTFLKNTNFVNGRCECDEHYYFHENHCYKIPLGANTPVDTYVGCYFLKNTTFHDGVCKCWPNYRRSIDGQCYRMTITLGNRCNFPGGCKVPNSQCINNTCECKPDFVEKDNGCYDYYQRE